MKFPIACALLILGLLSGCSDKAFMGDSITYFWSLPRANLGFPGDTTGNMLNRFPKEVLGKGFTVVVILGGTNDVKSADVDLDAAVSTAIDNIEQMATSAEQEGIEVVLCSVPPILGLESHSQALNTRIQALAQQHHYKFVDYYTPMEGHPAYFKDSMHPNDAGYAAMEKALRNVLSLED